MRVLGYWEIFDGRWLISEIGGRCEGRVWHGMWQVAMADNPNEWGPPMVVEDAERGKAECSEELKRRGFVFLTDLIAEVLALRVERSKNKASGPVCGWCGCVLKFKTLTVRPNDALICRACVGHRAKGHTREQAKAAQLKRGRL